MSSKSNNVNNNGYIAMTSFKIREIGRSHYRKGLKLY
jgi:hypothetical protein